MKSRLLTAPALALLLAALPLGAANIQIMVTDGAGTGFNDTTPASPVGGNTGTTLGAQRLIVFQEAARIWGSLLPSDVTITVDSSFQPLDCNANSAVLGFAGATNVVANFPNAPVADTWYNKAEADKLAGTNLGSTASSIQARFNSNLGMSNCLANTFFYLGLDLNHGNNVDLLTVVLHEFGHGLGFTSQVNQDGTLLGSGTNALPGIYDRFVLDTSTGKTWDQMTNAERFASGTNAGHVVWNGSNASTYAKAYIGRRSTVVVAAPAASAGKYFVGTASFGPAIANVNVSGPVVVATDAADGAGPSTTDACSAITNAAAVAGKIALVDRGSCAFVVKAKNVQNAGATAMILVDNVQQGIVDMSGTDPTVVIPSVRMVLSDGNTLKANLPTSATIGPDPDPTSLAGADSSYRLLLYTPNPYLDGSSFSHWDTSASPNLLMEPNISSDLTHSTDATLPAFRDLGWFLGSTTLPTTYVLASSAHASGANNAFYTTSLTVTNTGSSTASVVLKFLGHDQNGTSGPEVTRQIAAGATLAVPDVLGSLFSVSTGYGAIRLNATTNNFKIVSQTSTPPPDLVGTFGQAVPAMTGDDLVTTAAPKALFSLRQDSAFRTNAVIANTTEAPAHVDLQLLSSSGSQFGTQGLDLNPLEMQQLSGVVTRLGGPNGTKDAVLKISTPTAGARLAVYAAVIDQQTNDPRTILPVTLGTLGTNARWLLPSSAHASGANNAFYTTDLTVGNTSSTDASVTLKFLGHDQDGSSGPEVTRPIPANSATTFTDVLGSLFGVATGYGAILVTSGSGDLRVLSQTSTPPPNQVGTFGQSVPAAGPADFVTTGSPKALVGLRQDAAFRTNAVIASATSLPTHVDLVLLSENGVMLGTSSFDLPPYAMHQIGAVVTTIGAPFGTANATLLVSTPTPGARVATYAAIIDQQTNDPRTILP